MIETVNEMDLHEKEQDIGVALGRLIVLVDGQKSYEFLLLVGDEPFRF